MPGTGSPVAPGSALGNQEPGTSAGRPRGACVAVLRDSHGRTHESRGLRPPVLLGGAAEARGSLGSQPARRLRSPSWSSGSPVVWTGGPEEIRFCRAGTGGMGVCGPAVGTVAAAGRGRFCRWVALPVAPGTCCLPVPWRPPLASCHPPGRSPGRGSAGTGRAASARGPGRRAAQGEEDPHTSRGRRGRPSQSRRGCAPALQGRGGSGPGGAAARPAVSGGAGPWPAPPLPALAAAAPAAPVVLALAEALVLGPLIRSASMQCAAQNSSLEGDAAQTLTPFLVAQLPREPSPRGISRAVKGRGAERLPACPERVRRGWGRRGGGEGPFLGAGGRAGHSWEAPRAVEVGA